MMATAYVRHDRGREWSYPLATSERAAAQLAILLRRDGYSGDPVPALLSGKVVRHKKFTYWVS